MNFAPYTEFMATREYSPMPDADYHGFPAMSASVLKKRTQAEMFHQKTKPETETTEALTFGSVLHAIVLEPWKFDAENFAKHFIVCKSITTKVIDQCREAAACMDGYRGEIELSDDEISAADSVEEITDLAFAVAHGTLDEWSLWTETVATTTKPAEKWKAANPGIRLYTSGIMASAKLALRIAASPGILLITQEMLDHAIDVGRLSIKTNPEAVRLLSAPDPIKEAALIGFDPNFLIRRKIKVDYLPRKIEAGKILYGNYLLDIKTTRSHVADFEKEAWQYGYWLQAAYYLDTHELFTGHRPDWFHFLVISKAAPAMARIYSMRNMRPTDPLYDKSKLKMARETLGLDATARIGRMLMFTSAINQHQQDIGEREATPEQIRQVWTGYEHEEAVEVL